MTVQTAFQFKTTPATNRISTLRHLIRYDFQDRQCGKDEAFELNIQQARKILDLAIISDNFLFWF